jgi:hypothetical protein
MKDENCIAEARGCAAKAKAQRLPRPIGGNVMCSAQTYGLRPASQFAGAPRVFYCLVPLKVPSPNWPSDTLPLIEFPATLPVYFTASV